MFVKEEVRVLETAGHLSSSAYLTGALDYENLCVLANLRDEDELQTRCYNGMVETILTATCALGRAVDLASTNPLRPVAK